ncbi:MAG: 1-acyl-sn-glycerol-3-phosphate acyltransferase [Rhodocyclaceae bacterium]|nr:1-acyl-sn-glycerol-3-phosphate acyltransferase [Rhodocyclaceae bacterium]MCA3023037.1 1-acyl-sn-glycerol-3-phosphate acyltransferase [Rhodocyclaceae bacterium]MCA3024296.1 1-acyl-sn-glycerol-3-phosphate acyltransferase [Rhodocyclaceae bacterium]MCA3031308.1 1-acyl-sn-glycerol-3-phosphate acyltransferase [Rhodocyclaceae bacterium]MCA3037024.1 1-acyl-sn-glycerol-3-phosphate acyltransferase [Rhodocyclaceae bacterium]
MHTTIFDTPIVKTLLRWFSIAFLKITGWKVEGALPPGVDKCVLIAAPHTSNWDLPYMLMVAYHCGLHAYWMGKASIFSFPFRRVMMWLGGIPVNREQSNNLVAASVDAITNASRPLQLVVPPEGSRGKVRRWKTGFYYIALGAKVPIVMAYMDYERKLTGIGPTLITTGDIEADMKVVKAFYAPFKGKNARQFDAET